MKDLKFITRKINSRITDPQIRVCFSKFRIFAKFSHLILSFLPLEHSWISPTLNIFKIAIKPSFQKLNSEFGRILARLWENNLSKDFTRENLLLFETCWKLGGTLFRQFLWDDIYPQIWKVRNPAFFHRIYENIFIDLPLHISKLSKIIDRKIDSKFKYFLS